MTHLDDEQLQRAADGELRASDAAAGAHLATCAACRQRVDDALHEEAEVAALLRHVDHPVPAVTAGAIAARARARDSGGMRWAASIVLALALAGVAYAAPGSPLPRWVERAAVWPVRRAPPAAGRGETRVPLPVTGGIAVTPGASLVIQFSSPQTTGEVHVSLTDSAEVVVRSIIGAATFTSGVDRLVIGNAASSASYEIRIPRAAPRVEMRVGERRIFLKDGSRLTTAATADAREPLTLPLSP